MATPGLTGARSNGGVTFTGADFNGGGPVRRRERARIRIRIRIERQQRWGRPRAA
jgi:hypothetical protein